MTQLADMPMRPMTGDETVEGTHVAILMGDDVVIKDVEMFTEMADADKFGEVNTDLLRQIADATNASIAGGQYPQIILTHGEDAPVVGRVVGPLYISESPYSGRMTIYGDMRFSRVNFETYVRSNDYPRRSAEIHIDTKIMHQLALLGRSNPAAAVRDVYFDDAARCLRATGGSIVQFQAVLPGSATTHPNGGTDMTPTEILKNMEEDDIKKLKAACEAKLSDGEKDTSDNADDEEKKSESEDKDDDTSKNADIAALTKRLDAMDKAVTSAAQKNAELMSLNQSLHVRAEWRPKLEDLKRDGYSTLDVDSEMNRIASFSNDEQREAHVQYIRDNFKRDVSSGITSRGFIAATPPASTPATHALNAAQDKEVRTYAQRKGITYTEALSVKYPERAKELDIYVGDD